MEQSTFWKFLRHVFRKNGGRCRVFWSLLPVVAFCPVCCRSRFQLVQQEAAGADGERVLSLIGPHGYTTQTNTKWARLALPSPHPCFFFVCVVCVSWCWELRWFCGSSVEFFGWPFKLFLIHYLGKFGSFQSQKWNQNTPPSRCEHFWARKLVVFFGCGRTSILGLFFQVNQPGWFCGVGNWQQAPSLYNGAWLTRSLSHQNTLVASRGLAVVQKKDVSTEGTPTQIKPKASHFSPKQKMFDIV